MSEIADAVQIIRVSFEGIEIAMKVGSGSIKAMQNAVKFLYGMLNYEKQMGKTNMKKLLMRGGDLQVLQFDKNDMKQVEKFAKKYGILYSVLPEMKKDSSKVEILFHSEAVPRVNVLLQKLNKGSFKMRSMDTFLGEADDKELAVFDKFLQEQKKGNLDVHADANLNNLIEKVGQYAVEKKSVSVDEIGESLSADKEIVKEALEKLAKIGVVDMPDEKGQYKVMMDRETFEDKIKRFRELSERMKLISASKNTNFSDITIAKSLIKEENDRAIKTRVPGTWGENARYIWLNKSDVMEIYGGKTLLSFIDREKTYKLYTDDNRVVETIKGDIIYKNHYDPVSKGVREHYEKVTTKQRTPQRKTR
ncbi:MAG: PcfB family protein [Lachnospiraceae bacterium]|nr:PcfB family protein [Lachnospiraceae bacterium]